MSGFLGTTQRLKRVVALVAAGLVATLVAACGADGSATNADGQTKLNLRTDVYFTGAVLPFLVGVDKGIYEKHGIELNLQPGKGSITTIQTVANGSDDIGYADAGALVQSRAKGIDVKMVSGMVQESPLALFAKADSGIEEPADLEGKTAGYTAGSAAEVIFPAYASAVGVDPDSVKFLKVDIPTRTAVFVKGRSDFTFGLVNISQFSLESQIDEPLVTFKYADAGIVALSSGVIVSDDFAKENPEVVEAFLTATAEAAEYSTKNIDEAVDSFFKVDPDSSVPRDVVKKQWLASAELAHTDQTEGQAFGCTSSDDWASTIEMMEQYADVDKDAVDVPDVAANQYIADGCEDEIK